MSTTVKEPFDFDPDALLQSHAFLSRNALFSAVVNLYLRSGTGHG